MSTDIICTHFTINGAVQLSENDTITVTAKSLQSIVCRNTTPEIGDISYTFNPPALRRTKNYLLFGKYDMKFFLNRSATLTIGGLHIISHNVANYTLKVNVKVDPGTQEIN